MPISEAEAAVMEVLWEHAPLTAEQILEQVSASREWREGTVKSLLNRLLKKKAVSAERAGRRYLYEPLLTRDAYVSQESEGLLERLFHGRVAPLVMHFSKRRGLSQDDIDALRRLIEEIDRDE